MDPNKVYRKERDKVYKQSEDKVQPSINSIRYRDKDHETHHANLHFFQNGRFIETIESDVTYAWANHVKNELKNQIPYCYGVLVVVSIYAKDQYLGGKNRSSSRTKSKL